MADTSFSDDYVSAVASADSSTFFKSLEATGQSLGSASGFADIGHEGTVAFLSSFGTP